MRLRFLVAAAALLSATLAAHADTLTFSSNVFGSGTFTATPTNDGTGSYLVTAINGDPGVSLLPVSIADGGNDNLVFPGASLPFDSLGLAIQYYFGFYDLVGSQFGPDNVLAFDEIGSGFFLAQVTVNEPTSVTPEPSSIALLGTGLLGVAGVVRKRFARQV